MKWITKKLELRATAEQRDLRQMNQGWASRHTDLSHFKIGLIP